MSTRWSHLPAIPLLSPRTRIALSLLGYAITAAVIGLIYFNFTSFGHDVAIWDRVGDQIRAGQTPYGLTYDPNLVFLYSPPWALIFAAVSWLPSPVLVGLLLVLELLAARVCEAAGSESATWGSARSSGTSFPSARSTCSSRPPWLSRCAATAVGR